MIKIKHTWQITLIVMGMFIITQFLGLYVVSQYSPVKIIDGKEINVSSLDLPYGMDAPEPETEKDFWAIFPSLIFAFVIAILFLLLLTKIRARIVLKAWFFIVVVLALGISLNAFFPVFKYSSIIAILIALPLAVLKVLKRNLLVHNLTELFIYPGIAAIFVPILNIWTIILLLVLISGYDIWAVWHSGIMQKMAKYQINKLKVFSGFFVPYVSKKVKLQMQKIKKSELRKKKVKVHVAILGGGDVVFPIIASGVMLKTLGLWPAIFVIGGAALGLVSLLLLAEKKKFYPAMPFITAGIFLGMLAGWIIF